MGTLFGTLDIGRKALQAQQLALQVTGNNISNVNTPGFSRLHPIFEADLPVDTGAGPIGTGVRVSQIESARDQFVELRLVQETQKRSAEEANFDSLNRLQQILSAGSGSLQSEISGFFNSFATLANEPESSGLRDAVLASAQNLASSFNSLASQFDEARASVNRSITSAVSQVNTLSGNIATLNQEILVAEGTGLEASGLRDKRQEYVKELSGLVDVQYYESTDGQFYVSIAGGHNLVSGNESHPLSAVPVGIQGLVEVRSGANNITGLISGGAIAGFLEIRDQKIPDYQNDLDTLADAIVSQVNTQHLLGTDLQGNAGVSFFVPTPVPTPPQTLPAGAARSFTVNPALVANRLLVAAGQSGEVGDNANALRLAALADSKTLNNNTATFAESFAALQFKVGTATQNSGRTLEAQNAVLVQLQNQRDAISGVSLDEEALDLIRFQRAYQAATKFISTIDQLTGEVIAAFGS